MDKYSLQPGCYYHIYNRGNNKENIFKEPRNYSYFLLLWKKHIDFHFLIFIRENIEEIKIKKAFSNYFNAYAKSINKAYDRTGSLFQERFGRKYISDEKYFTEVIFYIHTNSQKHGITGDFTNYPYSSYQSLLSDKPTLLQRKEVIDWFGDKNKFIDFHKSNMEIRLEYLRELERMNF